MKVSEYFGENVFSRAVMQERLPKKVYRVLAAGDLVAVDIGDGDL